MHRFGNSELRFKAQGAPTNNFYRVNNVYYRSRDSIFRRKTSAGLYQSGVQMVAQMRV
jgi:hypothetical protein